MGQIYEGDAFSVVPMHKEKTAAFDNIRDSIIEFAIAMEIEMSKKDLKYGRDSTIYSIEFLTEHLLEEREEVDLELKNINNNKKVNSSELCTELIHESIMTMLVRNKIKTDLTEESR